MLRFCILQAIKNWSWGRPGNEARSCAVATLTVYMQHVKYMLRTVLVNSAYSVKFYVVTLCSSRRLYVLLNFSSSLLFY